MFRKANNKVLGIIFVFLLVIVIVAYLSNAGKKERTFREELVNIDTTAVTKIVINTKSNGYKPFSIYKSNEGWLVELKNGKTASVKDERVKQILNELVKIKPKSLAARGNEKWGEFQVKPDSSGTRVQVYEGDNVTLDIILGRLNYIPQPRSVSTYVRLYKDNDVYEVDGFLALTFNQGADSFRDNTIIKSDQSKWNELQFNYPADSSFTLIKTGSKWFINNVETDSMKTITALRKLATFMRTNFADTIEIPAGKNPSYQLTIKGERMSPVEVKAYVDSSYYLVTSNQNPETKFDGKTFGKDLFITKSAFFK